MRCIVGSKDKWHVSKEFGDCAIAAMSDLQTKHVNAEQAISMRHTALNALFMTGVNVEMRVGEMTCLEPMTRRVAAHRYTTHCPTV